MPQPSRIHTAGLILHVLNRAARRTPLFESDPEYSAFLRTLREAQRRIPLRILAYCVMPNHFHLVVWPNADGELSRFMQWFTATHSKRWHLDRGSSGNGCVYQGRFRAFPVQSDEHFLTVCRYVERNAVRAGVVGRAEDWRWSSFADRWENGRRVALTPWPVMQPADWAEWVNTVEPTIDIRRLRQAVARGAPYGDPAWVANVSGMLGCEGALRPIGRPRKATLAVALRNT